ncbi:hypothetical protein Tco_0151963 [Tanacetum coccineum]
MGIYDFLCLPKWEGTKVQEELHHNKRPTLQRLLFYCTPPAAADVVIPNPTLEDLAVTTPNTKVLAKADASKKRRASTSWSSSSYVAKRNRFATTHSSSGSSRPNLFDEYIDDEESDDDPNACVEIPLITPIRSDATIPLGGNQGEGYAPSATEGSRGKSIADDCADIPSGSVSRPRGSTGSSSSVQDTAGDAIDKDFFLSLPGPYYANYPKDDIIGGSYEISLIDPFPTPGEMAQIEALSDEQLSRKMSILHCLIMSHGGELLARYRGLIKFHNDHVFYLKKQVTGLNEKVTASDVAFIKAKGKSKDRYKHSLAEKDAEILRLKASPPKFASFF